MHYERKGPGVEGLGGDSEVVGHEGEAPVERPESDVIEQGRGEEMGVDPPDAAAPQGGPFDEAEDLTVLSDAGGPQSTKTPERLGPRCDNAQRELTEDEGM